jgi:Na+/proline symporter
MIATEISALTFIGVPGGVFALNGDWTYLQWGIGSIIARFAVGYWLVPLYFKEEIYSPYDYMGARLGEGVKRMVTGLFSLGAILGQSVRVLVTALILETVTGLPTNTCILAIGAFAVVWTLLGGMRTVIWTDVIQFGIFMFGGLLALGWLVTSASTRSGKSIAPQGQTETSTSSGCSISPSLGTARCCTTPSGWVSSRCRSRISRRSAPISSTRSGSFVAAPRRMRKKQ